MIDFKYILEMINDEAHALLLQWADLPDEDLSHPLDQRLDFRGGDRQVMKSELRRVLAANPELATRPRPQGEA